MFFVKPGIKWGGNDIKLPALKSNPDKYIWNLNRSKSAPGIGNGTVFEANPGGKSTLT